MCIIIMCRKIRIDALFKLKRHFKKCAFVNLNTDLR